MMTALSLLVVCAVLALSSADHWYPKSNDQQQHVDAQRFEHEDHAKSIYDNRRPSSSVSSQALTLPARRNCQSASYQDKGLLDYVHVCESGLTDLSGNKAYCIGTNTICCSPMTKFVIPPIVTYVLTLNNKVVRLSFYTPDKSAQGICYLISDDYDLPTCSGCRKPTCRPPPNICVENTLTGDFTSCDPNGGGCKCKEGYAPPDCCECDLTGRNGQPHYRLPNGLCGPLCRDFCATTPTITGGCSRCLEGYKEPDCCECDPGFYKAPDGTCRPKIDICAEFCLSPPTLRGCSVCQEGYKEPECCECKDGYYTESRKCLRPKCPQNVDYCKNGVCVCKKGFPAPDCCCTVKQDMYFLIDATISNRRLDFCQTMYGIELMIAAMNPGDDTEGTRIGTIMYPKVNPGDSPVPNTLFEIGASCVTIRDHYGDTVDSFYNVGESNLNPAVRYPHFVRGVGTHPTETIKSLTSQIHRSITIDQQPVDRARVVIVVTDGNNDGEFGDLEQVVHDLNDVAPGITIIAAGNDKEFQFEPDLAAVFEKELTMIANKNKDNVIIETKPLDLAGRLVDRMAAIGAICLKDALDIKSKLQKEDNSLSYCYCSDSRGPRYRSRSRDTAKGICSKYCKYPNRPRDCRAPPQCTLSSVQEVFQERTQNIIQQSDRADLEKEILAAVEDVLEEKMQG